MSRVAAVLAALVAAALVSGVGFASSRASSTVVARIATGKDSCGIAGAAGSVWVTKDRELLRIDPATNTVSRRFAIDPFACELRFAYGSLWIVTQWGVVERFNPVTGRMIKRIRVGRTTYDVASGAGSMWVSNRNGGTV
ncbi:MAG: virginiamycin lyase, partial [Gaiellaceae bacterium]|nr:virginiamycin lyase [Gaiellaceae bacterium]